MLRIAIPNKGALSDGAVNLIKEAGYSCKRRGRELVVRDVKNNIEFYYLRPRDIAVYVSNGIVQLGITGRDLALDSGRDYYEQLPLNFGGSRFFYALPNSKDVTPDQFDGYRIATSYPAIVAADMERRGLSVEVVPLDGAVEISIELGVADAIADVVESGMTLREAGLHTVGEPILTSEAILISKKDDLSDHDAVTTFINRLNGIIIARKYVLVEYDAPEQIIPEVTQLTPGIESPTISPLNKEGWVAIKSMVPQKGINTLIDELYALGARGIFVSEIKTCRI